MSMPCIDTGRMSLFLEDGDGGGPVVCCTSLAAGWRKVIALLDRGVYALRGTVREAARPFTLAGALLALGHLARAAPDNALDERFSLPRRPGETEDHAQRPGI
jgi:hypothetical protein